MVGKPLDNPAVLAFLADPQGFGSHLTDARGWLHSGRASVVRYEELHQCPVAALTRLTDQIAPVERGRIEAAIEACRAENVRQKSALWAGTRQATRRLRRLASNVRMAKVGDSRERLTQAPLAIFRQRYAELIRSVGYGVR